MFKWLNRFLDPDVDGDQGGTVLPDVDDNEDVSADDDDQSTDDNFDDDDGGTSFDVPDPEDEDAFNSFLEGLTDEQFKDFAEDHPELGIEKEDNGSEESDPKEKTGNEEGLPVTHEISQEEYDSLSEGTRSYLDSIKEQNDKLSQYNDPDVIAELKMIAEDEFIVNRIKALKGESPEQSADIDALVTEDMMQQLKIDMQYDAKNSLARMKGFVRRVTESAQNNIRVEFENLNKRKSLQQSIENELGSVQQLDKSLASDLSYDDASHPMNGFMKYLTDSKGAFDITKISGPEAYRLYLKSENKLDSFEKMIAKNSSKRTAMAMSKAKSTAAKTIPARNRQAGDDLGSKNKVTLGKGIVIDRNRFSNDPSYNEKIWNNYGSNPAISRKLTNLTYNKEL